MPPLRRLVVLLCALAWLPSAAHAQPPSFVLIVLDDLGYGGLGAYGSTQIETPEMDRLAAEGMRFTQAYAQAPLCSPSRAALLTGRHPAEYGIRDVLGTNSQRGLPPDAPSLARVLGGVGYVTGHFGKWHLGQVLPQHLPAALGFHDSAIRYGNDGDYEDPLIRLHDGTEVQASGHLTDVTTDYALAFLEANRDVPFFLDVWYHAPHRPFRPPERWALRYPNDRPGRYAALVSHVDEQIGRIVARLRELGLSDHTLVLVTSDNGSPYVEQVAPNGALRGTKNQVYEGGIRVPLIAWWPGRIAPGSTSARVVAGMDVLPTFAELASAPSPASVQGRSFAATLLGAPQGPRPGALVWDHVREGVVRWAVREERYKLVREGAVAELFDLEADPGERTDLAAREPARVAELEAVYRRWRRGVGTVTTSRPLLSGSVSTAGPWLRFSGGSAVLAPDPRLGIHDGDLSLQLRVMPAALGITRVLAEQPDSWSLVLSDRGAVRLVVQEAGTPGSTQLESPPLLSVGGTADVAFAIHGSDGRSDVRLYVDSVLRAETREISAVNVSQQAVRVAGGTNGEDGFLGTVWGLALQLASLTPEEVADRDRDGVPNAEDDCIGSENGPVLPDAGGHVQLDADGDGFGNACDADFDGNGVVGTSDLLRLSAGLAAGPGAPAYDPVLDVDGSGGVGVLDWMQAGARLGEPPGPSATACAGGLVCPVP